MGERGEGGGGAQDRVRQRDAPPLYSLLLHALMREEGGGGGVR